MKPQIILNIHQLKTAGKTLESVFYRKYGAAGVLFITKIPPTGENIKISENINKLNSVNQEDLSRTKLVTGHMTYGVHEYFNDYTYTTFLRNPVSRIKSYYYYMMDSPEFHITKVLKKNNIEFEEFVRLQVSDFPKLGFSTYGCDELSMMLENGQAKLIAGDTNLSGVKLERETSSNIDRDFSFIGVTERFDYSLVLYAKKFNWLPTYFFINTNVGKLKSKAPDISMDTVNYIEDRNFVDKNIYEDANKKLDVLISENKAWVEASIKFLKFRNILAEFYLNKLKIDTK